VWRIAGVPVLQAPARADTPTLAAIVGIVIVAPFHNVRFLVDLLQRGSIRRRNEQNKDGKS
jgi:hypothetical protein